MTRVSITPIMPKKNLLDPKIFIRAVENAGTETAKAIEVDFNVTTRTWKHKPDFTIEHTGGKLVWIISTDDKIYLYVSGGTKPHIIKVRRAKRLRFYASGFSPKSRVGWIGSNQGKQATKNLRTPLLVHHPGNEAREFAKAIKKKWDVEWPRQCARAIKAALRWQ